MNTDDRQADEFDVQAYLAWCLWLLKVTGMTLSVALNIVFFLMLLSLHFAR